MLNIKRKISPGLRRALEAAGGGEKLGLMLGITRQGVQRWGEHVPAKHIIAIEKATGVPREELRPDLYR